MFFHADFPWRIQIGSQLFTLHAIFELLAFFIGFRYYQWLRKKQGDAIESENRTWIIIGATFGAIIGSRLVGGFESLQKMQQSQYILLHFYANKSIVGGLLGGLFGVEIIKKIVGEKQRSGDLFVYPILLALIIGRIGCLSMGVHEDVYGVPTYLITGMNLGDGVQRHPLMLYEMAFLFFTWWLIKVTEKRLCKAPGDRFKLLMVVYLLFRFCIEFLKPRETWFLSINSIQIAALLGLIYYLSDIILFLKRALKIT